MEQCLFQVDVQRILLCFSLFKNQSLVSKQTGKKEERICFTKMILLLFVSLPINKLQ